MFAFIYRAFGSESITFSVDMAGKLPDFRAYLYYSVVTFTTLGFGDIIPKTNWARLAVGAEVVLGYVMLGGLISIFANKLLARRSAGISYAAR
jgi:voltage-gated potassium channel Kch